MAPVITGEASVARAICGLPHRFAFVALPGLPRGADDDGAGGAADECDLWFRQRYEPVAEAEA